MDETAINQFFAQHQQRHDLIRLVPAGGVGVELGVATGRFSELLLKQGHLGFLYSIDMWRDRKHLDPEYIAAVKLLMPFRNRNSVIRSRFDQALGIFDDGFFDFIYIDGYADTGEEDGGTLRDWWPKLKPGGVFAGHDYAPEWPKVVAVVDRFAAQEGLPVRTIGGTRVPDDGYNRFRSWCLLKPRLADKPPGDAPRYRRIPLNDEA